MSYERVKYYYEAGLWNEAMVKMAVRKGVITEAQYQEIVTGTTEEATEADYQAALREMGVKV